MSAATLQPPKPQTPVAPPAPREFVAVVEQASRPLWPISVRLFSEMVKTGVLNEKDPVYLWKGQLVERMAPKRKHSISVKRVYDAVSKIIPKHVHADREQPLAFRHDASVPQSDVVVLRGAAEDYPEDFPTTGDVVFVVEVADSSLQLDRRMSEDYAIEGIGGYWLVNISDGCVEVYSEPAGNAYAVKRTYQPGDEIPLIIDGTQVARIAVKELLP